MTVYFSSEKNFENWLDEVFHVKTAYNAIDFPYRSLEDTRSDEKSKMADTTLVAMGSSGELACSEYIRKGNAPLFSLTYTFTRENTYNKETSTLYLLLPTYNLLSSSIFTAAYMTS